MINGSLQKSDLSKKARTALKGNRGLKGATGVQGLQGQPATKLFAVINADGSLLRGSGVTSSSMPSAAVYHIAFSTNITGCAYLANAGQDAGGAIYDNYHLYTSRTGTDTVVVEIYDNTNSPLQRPFYLAVLC